MEDLPRSAIKAKNLLLVMFGLFLILDAVIIILKPDISGILRFILTVSLMWCVMQGYRWAKWLTIVLYFIGAAIVLIFGIYFIGRNFSMGLAFVLSGAIISIIPLYILRSKNLELYFSAKRDEKHL